MVDTFPSIEELSKRYAWLPATAWGGEKYDSSSKVRSYHGPLLMKHGDADTVAPDELEKQLFELANEPKRLLTEPGGKLTIAAKRSTKLLMIL